MKILAAQDFIDLIETPGNTSFAHVEAEEQVWMEIILSHPSARTAVALNKTLPESVIRKLSDIGDDRVLYAIARKRHTPADMLFNLAQHEDVTVRRRVAFNPKSPRSALELLVKDKDAGIREHVRSRLSVL